MKVMFIHCNKTEKVAVTPIITECHFTGFWTTHHLNPHYLKINGERKEHSGQ